MAVSVMASPTVTTIQDRPAALRSLQPLRATHPDAGPGRLIPELKLVALTDQHTVLLQPRKRAQGCRQQNTPVAVELTFGGVTDQQPLQAPGRAIKTGQAHELLLDVLPLGQGIDQKAVIAIHRDHQIAIAQPGQPLAIAARQRDPAFRIQIDVGDAPKHQFSPVLPMETIFHHFFPLRHTL